jgi:hypothetical protein
LSKKVRNSYKIKQRQGKRPGVVAKRTTKGDLTQLVEKSPGKEELVTGKTDRPN